MLKVKNSEKTFAFNVDIFNSNKMTKKELTGGDKDDNINVAVETQTDK